MKFSEKLWAYLHFTVLLALIAWNYYSNTGAIDGKTVGSVSDSFDNLFTPASYAFAIWGLIYLGLLVLSIYMIYRSYNARLSAVFVKQAAPTLTLAHLGNGFWLWFWLHEASGLSVLIMLGILGMLTLTVIRLNMMRWDAPFSFILMVWWPIGIYLGWISVATIANVSAHLSSFGWSAGLSESAWTIVAIALATTLAIILIIQRNMRVSGVVIIWALLAIAVRHWGTIPLLQWGALVGSILVAVVVAGHAYSNRSTLPLFRDI